MAELSPLKALLAFFTLSPAYGTDLYNVLFCLLNSAADHTGYAHRKLYGKAEMSLIPVAFFSMNGPHFGDRYGIAENLHAALIQSGVRILGLNCSIASISGIVPAKQIQAAIIAIKASFDVPNIIQRG